MDYIQKRDGSIVPFDSAKITCAIKDAFDAVGGYDDDYAYEKADNIASYIEEKAHEKTLTVEEIQDMVEHGLMSTKAKDVARAYISYRNDRTHERELNSEWRKELVKRITASDVQNQNANVDEYSFGGRKGEADSVIMRKIALEDIVSPMARARHENNEIYIHDLDSYAVGMHNCLSVPFDHLLADGFNTRQTDIRPANSISTAFQLVAVLFQLQSLQQFGGVSATHIDWTMVPYVRKTFFKHWIDGINYIEGPDEAVTKDDFVDINVESLSIEDSVYDIYPRAHQYAIDMTRKETEQAVEGMYHNLNTLQSRSGN